jgi:UDP-2,4-diacetamido-2,4,6-trideoxy-beta-L-altropyranose hydrolase
LAEALEELGGLCRFAVAPAGGSLLHRFARPGLGVDFLHALPDRKALAAHCKALKPKALIVDDYGLAAEGEGRVVPAGTRLVVIDDLANRPHLADLLIDPGFGRQPQDYAPWVPSVCQVLSGPAYALVRGEIAAAARMRPPLSEPPRRALVSFGLSDVGAIAARAASLLLTIAPELELDVALAGDAPSLPRLAALASETPRLSLHPDARDMAGLLAGADLAIGAGGSATWERCAFALPTLAVIVANNQRAMIRALADAGVVLTVDLEAPDFEAQFTAAFNRLRDPNLRRTLASRSLALCDGQGADRAARAILGMIAEG